MESDAEQCLQHVKESVARASGEEDGGLARSLPRALFDLHKYVLLYGLRFTKEEHARFVRLAYLVYTTKDMNRTGMERAGQARTDYTRFERIVGLLLISFILRS